jgi:hypothetical protein
MTTALAPPGRRRNEKGLADRVDHLELDQAIQLDGVPHRQLLRARLGLVCGALCEQSIFTSG